MSTLRSLLLYLAVAALTLLAGCDLPGRPSLRDRDPAPTAAAAQADRDAPRFAPGQLEQHFDKHGGEMGIPTKEAYLRAAQALVRGGPGIETYQRGDDTLFFKESTDEFAVLSGRGVIRTYFKPNDGRRYWERQKRR
jgi:pyocin large subunit-like protein